MDLPAVVECTEPVISGDVVSRDDVTPLTARTVPVPEARNPALVYLRSLGSPTSQATMRDALNVIARTLTDGMCHVETLPWEQLRYQHTSAVASVIRARYAKATANKILSGLRRVIRESWRLGYIDAETRDRTCDFGRAKGSGPAAAEIGRALSPAEFRALVDSCAGDGALGVRDAALLVVLYAGGLRRAEAVRLDLADYDDKADPPALLVRGKGNKARVVYCANGAADTLADWLQLRGREPGGFFLAVLKSGRIDFRRRRLTGPAVYHALAARAAKAGVNAFSPHDLRRSFAGDMLDAGVDIAIVSALMGHASLTTTAGYDRRGPAAKKRAAGMLHIPHGPLCRDTVGRI